jgi:hypothetical protein
MVLAAMISLEMSNPVDATRDDGVSKLRESNSDEELIGVQIMSGIH